MASIARDTAMHAQAYVRAARKVALGSSPIETIDMRMPENFLLGHACELMMKSLLIDVGYDDAELKSLGHGLMKAVAACQQESIALDSDFVAYCETMDPAHSGFLTRYAIRTFPWVAYDQALEIVERQAASLPWVWPTEAVAIATRAPLRGRDERLVRAMEKAVAEGRKSIDSDVQQVALEMATSGRAGSSRHFDQMKDRLIAGLDRLAGGAFAKLRELSPDEASLRLYRGDYVRAIDETAPHLMEVMQHVGQTHPPRSAAEDLRRRAIEELRTDIDQLRTALIDEFDLKSR